MPCSPSPPPAAPALWTLPELALFQTDEQLVEAFVQRGLLRTEGAGCSKCQRPLALSTGAHWSDGRRFRCYHCRCDFGSRSGSIFEHFRLPLRQLAQLVVYFNDRALVHQAAGWVGCSEDSVGKLWRIIRERCSAFITAHPIRFGHGEIVEIDELYLKPLRHYDEEEEKTMWPPLIGMISRDTGAVALELAPSHATADIRNPIESHLPAPDTRVVTDEAKSFDFLHQQYQHANALYEHRGGAKWCLPVVAARPGEPPYRVHTNTIEGYWSLLRTWLHTSHGWPAAYLPLYLAECMFRSLHLPLTVALQAE
jgi:transposase